ncbi:MAG: glycine cleavage system protein GcvH [Alphaproteobacteria bacterium]|nr:glycine cleavage system protein GcvH [Alphaproteobacteria bacterium]MCY3755593.1 glycine cleavage system protein GcvH [Alphaproteobacteria bacterium]MDE0406576.1 glycine cleavage system protein GcvH [Alphaproteobacteria bacterium]MDE0650528.1 glycine cleavage system protein GcvH [Gammaproteobacteria bacterium]
MAVKTYYTREHEWVRMEDGVAVCGITDYAQTQLGDVVYVELPEVGAEIARDGEAAVVESTKAASDVYAPLTGTIVAVNDRLEESPDLVNESAEDQGWFFRMEIGDEGELDELMDEEAYQAFVEELD